jgi:hypothetical protein
MKKLEPQDIKFNGKKVFVHFISWVMLFTQMAMVPARAQSDAVPAADNAGVDVIPTDDVALPDAAVANANAQRDANQAHEDASLANGGQLSNCSAGDRTSFGTYTDANQQYSSFTQSNTANMRDRISELNSQGSELLNQQQQYAVAHGDFADPSKPIDDRYQAIKDRYDEASANYTRIQREVVIAEAEYNAAQAACNDDSWCSPRERERINVARARYNSLNSQLIPARNEYNAARSAYRNSPRDVAANAPGAWQATAANSNAMAGSHAVSGCGTNFDVTTNTDEDCALSGPLFEADQELNRIAMAGIDEAKQMAASRADALFNLELEKLYMEDYKMYEMAVTAGLPEGTNLDDVEGMSDSNPNKTRNLKFTISNIKTVALASSSVKDVVCEQHDQSEVDSKATYVFKAAAATWLMAVANDTRYYSQESSCRTEEALGGDEHNMQMVTVERAANVLDQQLQNLCLRVGGQVDKDGDGTLDGSYLDPPGPGWADGDGWKAYGETLEQAQAHVKVLEGYTDGSIVHPPLKERCEEYLVQLRGEEFRDKPRTREVALEMMREAEALALEELMGKMEKIKIADANVKKGEKWVDDVIKKIAMMIALKAVLTAAWTNAAATCAGCSPWCGFCCAMCPVKMDLAMKIAFVSDVVLVYLALELMRARSFLAKWRRKLYEAKHFSHVACNFETSKAEEDRMAELGEEAKARKAEEVERARREAVRGIYDDANDMVGDTLANSGSQTYSPRQIDQFNRGLINIKTEAQAIAYISKKVLGKEFKTWKDLKKALAAQGLDLIISSAVSEAKANEVTGQFTEDNTPTSAETASSLQKRNVRSNTNSLNIAEGTESFRYFLVQRNLNFQYQTADITVQPDHTRSDSRIANRGQPKNRKNTVLKSIDQLAQFHLDGNLLGGVRDGITQVAAVADLEEEDQNGFPTPETRYMTIQKARRLFEENLELLHGGIAELAFQRDAVVQLLTQMRKRMKNDKTGVGETQLIPNAAPAPMCMVGDVSNLDFDPTCGCSKEGSCTSFEYPSFKATTPNALKAGARLSTDAANDLASGNLSGAALNGGKLVSNAAAVRKDLFEKQKKLGLTSSSSNSSSSSSSNGGNSNGSDFRSENEKSASDNLAKLGVSSDSNSAFGRVRRSLMNGKTGSDSDKDANKKAIAANDSSKNSRSGRRGGRGSSKGKGANGKDKNINESFSLTDGNTKLNLEGLTDEERAQLGLGGGLGAGLNGADKKGDSNRYAHVRNVSPSGSGSGVSKDHPDYGIHTNRKKSLWKIISRRYEKTAFPALLSP